MKLRKQSAVTTKPPVSISGAAVNRRDFLKNSGLMAGGAFMAGGVGPGMMRKAQAAAGEGSASEIKTICTHCSVGSLPIVCSATAGLAAPNEWSGRWLPAAC